MFLPFSLILSIKSSSKSMIENCSVISYWLGAFRLIECSLICFKPILDRNSWFYDYQNINPSFLIMLFSLPLLQWYWIRIVVSINQPFISIIIVMIITNDPTITYWTITNGNDSSLPIIPKWWFELGFVQYW